jgi:hypothetical protein
LIVRGSNVGTRQSFRSSLNRADHPLVRPGSGSKGTVGSFPEKLSDRSMVLTSHLYVMSSPPSINLHAQRQPYLYITLFSDFILCYGASTEFSASVFRESKGGNIMFLRMLVCFYRGADKSLARHTSQCILYILFDAGLVMYIYIYY